MDENLARKVSTLVENHRVAVAQFDLEKKKLKKARAAITNTREAQQIVQVVAQKVQQQAHDQIAKVVTRCLEAVFDHPYQFRIDFDRKRGKTEARLVFVRRRNGEELEINPIDGVGGGVLDIAAFALRLACLLLQKPRRRRVIVMDEPFKFVSERREYRQRVKELLETLSKEMQFQFIMVTHDPILQAGRVIEVS